MDRGPRWKPLPAGSGHGGVRKNRPTVGCGSLHEAVSAGTHDHQPTRHAGVPPAWGPLGTRYTRPTDGAQHLEGMWRGGPLLHHRTAPSADPFPHLVSVHLLLQPIQGWRGGRGVRQGTVLRENSPFRSLTRFSPRHFFAQLGARPALCASNGAADGANNGEIDRMCWPPGRAAVAFHREHRQANPAFQTVFQPWAGMCASWCVRMADNGSRKLRPCDAATGNPNLRGPCSFFGLC